MEWNHPTHSFLLPLNGQMVPRISALICQSVFYSNLCSNFFKTSHSPKTSYPTPFPFPLKAESWLLFHQRLAACRWEFCQLLDTLATNFSPQVLLNPTSTRPSSVLGPALTGLWKSFVKYSGILRAGCFPKDCLKISQGGSIYITEISICNKSCFFFCSEGPFIRMPPALVFHPLYPFWYLQPLSYWHIHMSI